MNKAFCFYKLYKKIDIYFYEKKKIANLYLFYRTILTRIFLNHQSYTNRNGDTVRLRDFPISCRKLFFVMVTTVSIVTVYS